MAIDSGDPGDDEEREADGQVAGRELARGVHQERRVVGEARRGREVGKEGVDADVTPDAERDVGEGEEQGDDANPCGNEPGGRAHCAPLPARQLAEGRGPVLDVVGHEP